MPKKLKVKDVAAAAGVNPETVWRWVRRGQFPAPLKVGGSYLFDAAQVAAALTFPGPTPAPSEA